MTSLTLDELAVSEDRCPVCEAYVHPFLAACPFCASQRLSSYEAARQAWETANRWLTDDEARAEIRKAFGDNYEIRDTLMTVYRDPSLRAKKRQRRIEGADRLANAYVSQLTLRYVGGLPAFAGPSDVDLTVSQGRLNVAAVGSGSKLVSGRLVDILAVQAFPADTPLISGWFGLSFGNAVLLQQPTFRGGALVVVQSVDGTILQWGVGNRIGFFTRKADFTGFEIMRAGLATGASMYARNTFGAVDPELYARQLGLTVPASP